MAERKPRKVRKPDGKKRPIYSQDPDRKLNESQEAFAMYLATPVDEQGRVRSALESYKLAYPDANQRTAEKKAGPLANMPAVQKRLAEIRGRRFASIELDAEWFNREFKKRHDANVADYWVTVEVDIEGREYPLGQVPNGPAEDGQEPTPIPTRKVQRIKRMDELTVEQQLMLDEYSIETTARGSTKFSFKLDKKGAREALARGFGYFKDKVDVTSGGKPIESLTEEERLDRALAILERARSKRDSGAAG